MSNLKRWIRLSAWVLVLSTIAAGVRQAMASTPSAVQATANAVPDERPSTSPLVDPAPTMSRTSPLVFNWRSTIAAVIVGSLGATAFYIGVWLGFISRQSRATILEYTLRPGNARVAERLQYPRIFLFCAFGGIIAAVFQWTQPDQFMPIQAFVLGATWPSVVTRVMAGDGRPDGGGGPTPLDFQTPSTGDADRQLPGEVVIGDTPTTAPAADRTQPGN